jgi:hypothetical protein
MYEGAAILFPAAGAHRSACSVNYGSGRLLARGEAVRKLRHKQDRVDDEMATVRRTLGGVTVEGIVGNHKHTPLDECAHVYNQGSGLRLGIEQFTARSRSPPGHFPSTA